MLFTASVLAVMCMVNYTHGYLIYNPTVNAHLELKDPTNFVDTRNWEQAAFRYNLYAGTLSWMQIFPPSTRGTSSSSTRISSSSGSTPSTAPYVKQYLVEEQDDRL
jgi:hypothetical protein